MGTVVSFDVRPGTVEPAAVHLAVAEARAVLHRADAVFSTWKTHSPVSLLRRGEIDLDEAPPVVAAVLERCMVAKELSGGWFDPWVMPGGLDPTGLVKGWAAGEALRVVMSSGAAGAMVSAGGDVAVAGEPEAGRRWRIGIQNPYDRSTVVAVAEPLAAIATSGCYERGMHIYDPHTGEPAAAMASATVSGPEIDLADAFATALVAGGRAALALVGRVPDYQALVIDHDGSITTTDGFPLAPAGSGS